MEPEIGSAAGTIWRYLSRQGQTTLSTLKTGRKLSGQMLLMGLGWLAREGKLDLAKDGRALRISLRQP